jgi:hypothetical protein
MILCLLIAPVIAVGMVGIASMVASMLSQPRSGYVSPPVPPRRRRQYTATAHPVEKCQCDECADARERLYGSREVWK